MTPDQLPLRDPPITCLLEAKIRLAVGDWVDRRGFGTLESFLWIFALFSRPPTVAFEKPGSM